MATGKTTLLHSFHDELVKSGELVLTASASREERHLPFGVVEQLLSHAQALPELKAEAAALTTESFGSPDGPNGPRGPRSPGRVYTLGAALLALARDRPVHFVVDDVQHADPSTLQCLLFMARRLRWTQTFMVFSMSHCSSHESQQFLAGLSGLPYVHRVRIAPLTVRGVADVLTTRLGPGAARGAARVHRATGGNLRLVNAMVEDVKGAAQGGTVELGVGRAFEEAARACLHRCDDESFGVVRAMAVLGELATPERIGVLLGLDVESVTLAVSALEQDGLLEAGTFRHPAICGAVLGTWTSTERAHEHRRAAKLLHDEGVRSSIVSRYLLAAGAAAEPWGVAALKEAAGEQRHDSPELAVQCLELARRLSGDEHEQAAVTTMMVSIEWRTNPANASRHVPKVMDLLRGGRFAPADLMTIIRYLLWHGRIDDAQTALEQLSDSVRANECSRAELVVFQLWLRYSYPALLERVPAAKEALTAAITPAAVATAPQLQAGELLNLVFTNGNCDEIVTGAEHILQTCRLTDTTLELLITALVALLHVDGLQIADRRCGSLLQEAAARGATTWQAELSNIHAVIAMRQGDLPAAVKRANAALTYLDQHDWGTRVGGPLATLVLAYTAMGANAKAEATLDLPVPQEMFQTGFGLYYWQARGTYYLSTGIVQGALSDFQACGELMEKWQVDLPGLVSWRIDLAQLYIRQGKLCDARTLVEEQLAMLRTGGSVRVRGIALRLLAVLSEPDQRPKLLAEAADILKRCGAQLELAHTLVDLGDAHRMLGEPDRAHVVEHQAKYLAKRCHAEMPRRTRHTLNARPRAATLLSRASNSVDLLSKAERRVAALAVGGMTNEDIARKLCLTVSTVEQHLTHAYRKLNVRRRTDLPAELQSSVA